MKSELKRYRLRSMPHAHCIVEIHTEGGMITDIVFKSYRTDVIILDLDYDEITCTGTYSQSTRKQIGRFMREFTINEDYSTMKELANTSMQFKPLRISDTDYARKIAKNYLDEEKALSEEAYTNYILECRKATSKVCYY